MKKLFFFAVLCLTFFASSISVLADTSVLDKQKEVDQYIFEEHYDELVEKGISVTHTSPQDEVVEIGITPFTDESANYLYEIFGADQVKVVEGQMATTFATGEVESTTGAEEGSNGLAIYIMLGLVALVGIFFTVRISKKAKA